MRAREILGSSRATKKIRGDQSILEAMRMMDDAGVGSLIVVDHHDHPIGIITESDIFRLALENRGDMMDLPIGANMSTGLIMGVLDDDLEFIAEAMTANNIQHMPIMDEKERLCGVISIRDIVGAIVKKKQPQGQTTG